MAVHEEVFRAWPSLASAIAARLADLQVRTWLRRDADLWASSGRGQVPLTGGRLELARDWSRRNPTDVTGPVRDYLQTAGRQQQRRRLLVVVVPILAVIALIVGILAMQANDARRDAEALRLAADARAAYDSRLDLGLQLALQAASRTDDLRVKSMLLVGLTRGPGPRRFEGPMTPVTAAALDDTGTRAVLAGADATVVWDRGQHRGVATLPGSPHALAISPDGSTLAIARPGTLEFRNAADGSVTYTCPTGEDIELLALFGAGDRAVAVTVDRDASPPVSRFKVLVGASRCSVQSEGSFAGVARTVAVETASQQVAIGTEGNGVTVWDATNGAPYPPFMPDDAHIWAIDLGGDEQLAALTDDGQLLTWNARDGGAAASLQVFDVNGSAVQFRGGGVITAANDGTLAVVKPTSQLPLGTPLRSLPPLGYGGDVGILAIAATTTGVVTLDRSGRLMEWDLTGRPPLGSQLMTDVGVDFVQGLADGSAVAAGGSSVWLVDRDPGTAPAVMDGITVTALAARDNTFAVGTESGQVGVAAGTLAGLVPVATHSAAVVGLAILPDGSLASLDKNGRLMIGSVAAPATTFPVGEGTASMTASGNHLVVGTDAGQLLVFDATEPMRQPVRVDAHEAQVTAMAMRPDERAMATGSDDRGIIVWDVDTSGRMAIRFELAGHGDMVTSLAYSPDGRWLASSGEDHRVIFWDADSGQQIGDPIAIDGGPVVAFSKVGDRQLFVAVDGLARWDMRPEAWAEAVCDIVGDRTLNDLERQTYGVGGQPGDTKCS